MLGKISSYPTYPIAVILKMAMHLEDPERTGLARGEISGSIGTECGSGWKLSSNGSKSVRSRSRTPRSLLSFQRDPCLATGEAKQKPPVAIDWRFACAFDRSELACGICEWPVKDVAINL